MAEATTGDITGTGVTMVTGTDTVSTGNAAEPTILVLLNGTSATPCVFGSGVGIPYRMRMGKTMLMPGD